MKSIKFSLIALCFLFSGCLQAELYKNIAADGSVTYSEKPVKGYKLIPRKEYDKEKLDLYLRIGPDGKKYYTDEPQDGFNYKLIIKGRPNSTDTKASRLSSSLDQLSKVGSGTLFMVSSSGFAITNHHVVKDCEELRSGGNRVELITSDSINDLALVKLVDQQYTAATIVKNPTKIRQGEDIIVYGFPLNYLLSSGGNLTPGVISAITGLGNNTNQIQITAPIQPGSSGSPVINKKGEVVGVVSMKLDDSKMLEHAGTVGQNVNFAVSGQTLKTFLDINKIKYVESGFILFDKNTVDLAEEARKWTLPIECWK